MSIDQTEEAESRIDQAMQAWFPESPSITERKPFNEADLRNISNVLRSIGRESWSQVPRIYCTLRIINQLPVIESFLAQGLSDIWFPFTHKTLPGSLKSQTARNNFIEAQKLVLTKALDLEKEDGKHRHFSKSQDIPLVPLGRLGEGASAVVDKVFSTLSRREYARKLLFRGPTFRRDKVALQDFEAELAVLKKLSHAHIVELVGSYTDPKFVGILMSPVADCNLKKYLDLPLTDNRRSLLMTSFGCLVAAVSYLHENRIRHKDIKPQNILVKDHQIYVTDFGISRDWSDLGHSTTTGFTSATLKYSAPEVAAFLPRNSSADMWSLGCVFLEIWTVLKGETVQALTEYLGTTGSKSSLYHSNITGVRSWCNMLLEKPGDTELKRPEAWISNMLEMEPHSRYIAHTLLELIQESCQGPDARYPFIGLCCTDYDDSAESVQSSVFEPNLVEYTTTDTTESTDLSKEVAGISEEGTRAECAEDKTLLPTQMTKSIVAANSVVKTGSDTHIKADSSTQRLGGQGSVISTLPVNTDMESGSTSAVVLSEDLAKGMINLERGVGDLQVKSWSGERVDGSSSSCSKSQGDNPLHNGKEIAPSTMQVSSSHTTVMPAGQAAIDKPDEETNHGPPTLGLITPEERKLYNEIFFSTISPGGCMLAGDQARAIFDQSGLPTDELAKIWLLSDPNCRGSLNPAEFSVAMHLINCKVNNIAIPDRLPHTLVVKLYGSIPLRSTAPVPRPAESTVRESREAAPLTRYANRQPTFKTETPYPTSDTDADTDVSMALELQKEREKQKREMQKKFEQQTHGQNILGPDGLLALDRSQLSTEVGPTTPIQIFITIWDAHGIAQPQDDLYSLSYRDLHESVFLDKLRSRIGVTRLQVVNFERYSVSAGGWVTLDSNNQEAWKMMHRAAETSLQLRIRATVFPEGSGWITNRPTPHIVDLQLFGNTVTLEIFFEGYQLPPRFIEVPRSYFRLPLDYTFDLTALHDLVGEKLGLYVGFNAGQGSRKFHLDWLPPWDGCVDMNGRNQADYQQVCEYVAAGNHVLRMSVEVLDEPAQTESSTALTGEENERVRENTVKGESKPKSEPKSWLRETWRYGFGRPRGS